MLYDGRGFLRHAEEQHPGRIFADGFETGGPACWSAVVGGAGGGAACPLVPSVGPVYSSDGVLHYQLKEGGLERFVFYFAGRPVLTLAVPAGGAVEPLFLAADHLGTPVLASDDGGVEVWSGGFEPFGRAHMAAQEQGVYLRLPGQWSDTVWRGISSQPELYYKVNRWLVVGLGKYAQVDPYKIIADGIAPLYAYALQNPIRFSDPLGLKVTFADSETSQRYDRLKKCFPLFRVIATAFEEADGNWPVETADFSETHCGTKAPRRGGNVIFVPRNLPDNDPCSECRFLMRCLTHEFYELWAILFGGFQQTGASGPADNMARHFEGLVPVGDCCRYCCEQ